ncbi:hypothetical protein BCR43DRAFT_493208 [Syncephalastrum racemosum]|uniref:Uncharacterized protein n=1 Tax=Syncephalastrum racemosum TaxID=13706 RepID=A0A1X2HAB0_SYNRA|nr:hypothetical protein BCR43DRAFT_493208 [Syncephalastrum racemosum]
MRPMRDSDFLDGCLTKPSRIMNEYRRLRAASLRTALSKSGCYSPLHRFLFKESYEYEEQRESENELVERKIRRLKQALRTFKVQSTKRKRRVKDERHVHPTPNRHAWLPPNPYPRLYRPKKRPHIDKSQATQSEPLEPKPSVTPTLPTLPNAQSAEPKLKNTKTQEEPDSGQEEQKPQHVRPPGATVEQKRPTTSGEDKPDQEPAVKDQERSPEHNQDDYIQKDRKMYAILHRRRHRPLSPYPRLTKTKSHIIITDENRSKTPALAEESASAEELSGHSSDDRRQNGSQNESLKKSLKPSAAPLRTSKKPFADGNAIRSKAVSDGKAKEAQAPKSPSTSKRASVEWTDDATCTPHNHRNSTQTHENPYLDTAYATAMNPYILSLE